MKNKWGSSLLIVAAIIVLALLLITLNANRNHLLEGKDREAVLTYSTPIAENLIAALQSGDAAAFSRDFGAKMKKGFTPQSFSDLRKSLVAKGPYQSYKIQRVEILDGYLVVTYRLQFQTGRVDVKVIFSLGNVHTVEGLSILNQ